MIMNIILRVLLTVLFVPALLGVTRFNGARARAFRAIAFVSSVIFFSISIFFPFIIEKAAEKLGLNSGLDLVVYSLTLSFVAISAYLIRRIRVADRKIAVLAQEIAIRTLSTQDSK
jgi:hypothetical protein